MSAQELRFFRLRSPGPLAYIAAPTAEAAIELFCEQIGNGDDEDRSELEVSEISGDALINIPDADEPGPDERTAAQWVVACNGIPTIVGHTEI